MYRDTSYLFETEGSCMVSWTLADEEGVSVART